MYVFFDTIFILLCGGQLVLDARDRHVGPAGRGVVGPRDDTRFCVRLSFLLCVIYDGFVHSHHDIH